MLRTRTLSDTGNELFSMMNPFSPKNKNRAFTKMNSWTEVALTSPEPSPRRKSTGCLNLKKFNLKKIYLDLMTTEFDKKLDLNVKNMRNASKKLFCDYTFRVRSLTRAQRARILNKVQEE